MGKPKGKAAWKNALASAAANRKAPLTLPAVPWDHGSDGPANRRGLVTEEAVDTDPETGKRRSNPNRVTRKRRVEWIEVYERKGWLDKRQYTIAVALRDAAEGARNADPLAAFGNKIDRDTGCPDPLAVAYDLRRKFHPMWALVPKDARFVTEWVVLDNRPIGAMPHAHGSGPAIRRHLERLCRGLDVLARQWGRK